LRMNESEANRVQRLTVECRHHGSTATAAIRRIANQRMLDCRKMNANLMRASRFQRALHERCGAEALERRDVGTRRFAARHDRHRRADARMTADRCVDRCRARDVALRERDVFAFHCARLQLPHEIGLRNRGFCDNQKAARILIESMNNAGARKRRELRRVMKERVQQRPVAVAAARVDDQARRLVDDENRVVLVHDGKLDRLRHIRDRERFLQDLDHDPLAARQPPFALRDRAIERDAPRVDPVLEPTAGMLGNQLRERLVEAQPSEVGGDPKLERSPDGIIAKGSVRSAIIRATHEGLHR